MFNPTPVTCLQSKCFINMKGKTERSSDVQKVIKLLWYTLMYRNADFCLPEGLTSLQRNYQKETLMLCSKALSPGFGIKFLQLRTLHACYNTETPWDGGCWVHMRKDALPQVNKIPYR